MGFARQVTETVTLNDGNTVVVKKLGYRAQEAAQMEFQRLALQRAASIGAGLVDLQQAVRKAVEANGGAEAIEKAVKADPFVTYDKPTLLEKGIVSWSLSEKPTVEEMNELDPADAETIARAIYDLSRPKTEEERKND